jgi:hypothetical protein
MWVDIMVHSTRRKDKQQPGVFANIIKKNCYPGSFSGEADKPPE